MCLLAITVARKVAIVEKSPENLSLSLKNAELTQRKGSIYVKVVILRIKSLTDPM